MKRLGKPLACGVPANALRHGVSDRAPTPNAVDLRKSLLLFMCLVGGGFAENERIGGEERDDDRIEAAAALDVSLIGIDESFGIGECFVASHEIAEGMADDRLPHLGRFPEALGEVEGVLEFAVQLRIIGSNEIAAGIDGQGFENVAQVILWRAFVGSFFEKIFGMLQELLHPVASEVIVHFEGQAHGVHPLMAAPAILLLGFFIETGAQGVVMILGDHGIDGDRHVGDGSGQ